MEEASVAEGLPERERDDKQKEEEKEKKGSREAHRAGGVRKTGEWHNMCTYTVIQHSL